MNKVQVVDLRLIYRPLEVERNFDGRAAGDRGVIGPDDVRVSRPKRARWLCRNHVLRVFEADSEEDVTVSVSPADALRRVERMDFQFKHARGENLDERERKRTLTFTPSVSENECSRVVVGQPGDTHCMN